MSFDFKVKYVQGIFLQNIFKKNIFLLINSFSTQIKDKRCHKVIKSILDSWKKHI